MLNVKGIHLKEEKSKRTEREASRKEAMIGVPATMLGLYPDHVRRS